MAVQVKPKTRRRSGRETRERIVAAAAALIYQSGFTATSLDTVAQVAEVNRGSLYYFFPSKKNLAQAVIDHYEQLLHSEYLDPAFSDPGGGKEKVERLAVRYSRMPSATAPCCGCPIANLSLEMSGMDEDLRVRLAGVWERLLGRIERVLQAAREEGDLPAGADVAALARSFFAQIQGAHILARCALDAHKLEDDCRRAFEDLPWIA